jgi:hypothetical protein
MKNNKDYILMQAQKGAAPPAVSKLQKEVYPVISWGNGFYSTEVSGPNLTEAQVLEKTGAEKIEDVLLLTFID